MSQTGATTEPNSSAGDQSETNGEGAPFVGLKVYARYQGSVSAGEIIKFNGSKTKVLIRFDHCPVKLFDQWYSIKSSDWKRRDAQSVIPKQPGTIAVKHEVPQHKFELIKNNFKKLIKDLADDVGTPLQEMVPPTCLLDSNNINEWDDENLSRLPVQHFLEVYQQKKKTVLLRGNGEEQRYTFQQKTTVQALVEEAASNTSEPRELCNMDTSPTQLLNSWLQDGLYVTITGNEDRMQQEHEGFILDFTEKECIVYVEEMNIIVPVAFNNLQPVVPKADEKVRVISGLMKGKQGEVMVLPDEENSFDTVVNIFDEHADERGILNIQLFDLRTLCKCT